MTDPEREFALERLMDGRDALLRAVDGLSEAQLRFQPQGRWSIAQCVEHLATAEDVLFALIAEGAPNPNGVSLDPSKYARLTAAIVDRSRKVEAPPGVRPADPGSLDDSRRSFLERRERTIAHVRECSKDLRRLFCLHPVLGEIDCYRCLILMALHPARHAGQIEEIKQDAAFPKS
jgi:hypothetical protein